MSVVAVFKRRLQASEHGFTDQLDETTDITGLAILLVIVRYNCEKNLIELLLSMYRWSQGNACW